MTQVYIVVQDHNQHQQWNPFKELFNFPRLSKDDNGRSLLSFVKDFFKWK